MLSNGVLTEINNISKELLNDDYLSIKKLCDSMNINKTTVKKRISMAIVLKIVSDEDAEKLINKLYTISGKTRSTENYYQYILDLKKLREKLVKKVEFLKFLLKKRKLNKQQQEELITRIKELQNCIRCFEKQKLYLKISEDFIKRFDT